MQSTLLPEGSMDNQITIRLPEELSQALKEKAARMQRKPSEVVRMAIREFLDVSEAPRERPVERVRQLIGSLQSGVPDLAVRHREYLIQKLRRAR
jgi:Arc/MetJ-type ribon-helix-helix transcriptional regulator